MSDHKDCKRYDDCDFRNDVGWCPESCRQYEHKDDVRVVRCKDCKHWLGDGNNCKMYIVIGNKVMYNWYSDDFCSYGERRNDG